MNYFFEISGNPRTRSFGKRDFILFISDLLNTLYFSFKTPCSSVLNFMIPRLHQSMNVGFEMGCFSERISRASFCFISPFLSMGKGYQDKSKRAREIFNCIGLGQLPLDYLLFTLYP